MSFIEFLIGDGSVTYAIAPLVAMGLAQGVGSLFSAFAAGKQKREARRNDRKMAKKIAHLENNRQAIVNPYENVRDLSGDITNPFDNLQVATQAAEMQASEQDLSLASTLDTLRSTGAGAGGATALAQAAARSKAQISASIEQQEMQNNKLRAHGEMQTQQMVMSEKRRLQEADAAGRQFVFGATENREMQQLDRASAMQSQYSYNYATAQSQQNQAIGGLFGSAASLYAGGAFSSSGTQG